MRIEVETDVSFDVCYVLLWGEYTCNDGDETGGDMLEKHYDPKLIEEKWFSAWEEDGLFTARNRAFG